jgi:Protein of unknown function (DUF1761)
MTVLAAFGSINWLAVLLAAVVYTALGALWFTLLFGDQYAAALGRTEPPRPTGALFVAGPAACTLVVTLTTALLMAALGIDTIGDAVLVALVVGVGYLVANTVNIAINPNMPRPLYYGLVTGSYHLVGIVVAGLVLGAL